jgi:disulfide oxidoreductase YuzD
VKKKARKSRSDKKSTKMKTDKEIIDGIRSKKLVQQKKQEKHAQKALKKKLKEQGNTMQFEDIKELFNEDINDRKVSTVMKILHGDVSLLLADLAFVRDESIFIGNIKSIQNYKGQPNGYVISSVPQNDLSDELDADDLYYNKYWLTTEFIIGLFDIVF